MHKTQAFGYVIREHLKVTVLSLRPYIIIAGALAAVATFLAFADYFRGRGGVEFAPELSMIPAIAGVLLAIAIWQSERPFKSGFFWTVPVDRTTNAGAKIFAAWLCLMIAVTAFVLWLLILAFITKGNIRGDEVVHLLPSMTIPPRRTLDASMLRTIQWTPTGVLARSIHCRDKRLRNRERADAWPQAPVQARVRGNRRRIPRRGSWSGDRSRRILGKAARRNSTFNGRPLRYRRSPHREK